MNENGHTKLIEDLKLLLSQAENFDFHDFKNSFYPAPKLALVNSLQDIIDRTKAGKYDNDNE